MAQTGKVVANDLRPNTRINGQYILKRLKESWQWYVLLLPAVIYIAIFNYAPIYGVQIAFRNYRPSKGFSGSNWVGLKHFIRFVSYPDFWKLFGNTLSITLYSLCTSPPTPSSLR